MPAFIAPAALSASPFTPPRRVAARAPAARPAAVRMAASTYRYSPTVDEFFAKDVRAQYIAKACPSGVPPLQCIEGATFDEPYDARTLKRQSQLRFRQLPAAVRLHNQYETRRFALAACHGCAHEEARVLANPMLASAVAVGSAEADRACSRYIPSSGAAEDAMVRCVENVYARAVNPAGTFTTACTDGQARYEAYLLQQRCKSAEFRAQQYSPAAKAGAAYAARKLATARNHVCVYEDGLYAKFPKLAGSMRPAHGYYTPFVTLPSEGGYGAGVDVGYMTPAQLGVTAAAVGAIGAYLVWAASHAPM